jgi:hypothetical protein
MKHNLKITLIKALIIVAMIVPFSSCAQVNRTQKVAAGYSVQVQLVSPQKRKINKDIFIYTCQFLSGSADGVNQALVHHYLGFGNRFWDFQTSWKNKYKDYDKGDLRPAFPGATTFAVSLTDGYHLTRMVDRAFSLTSIGFALGEKQTFKGVVKKIIISSLVNRAGFFLFFDVIYPGNRAKRF